MDPLDAALLDHASSAPPPSVDPLDAALKAHADEITLPTMRVTPTSAKFMDPDPTTGGSTLQVYNPFGKNLDTGIPTSQGVDRFLSGAGKAYSDIGLGIRQRLGQATQADGAEAKQLDAPLMATGAGQAGNLGGNLAIAAPAAFVPGVNGWVGSTMAGAALGGMQPTAADNDLAGNMLVGAGGGVAGKALGSLLSMPAAAEAGSATKNAALKIAEQLGFKTTPAQRSGSQGMAKVEAMLSSHPESAGPFAKVDAANQKTLNTIAAKAVGENADNLSAETLGNANTRLGAVFDSVADKTPVPLDPQTYGPQLAKLKSDYSGMLNGNADVADNGLFKRLDSFVNDQGGATREQLRSLSSNLGTAARNNLTSQGGDRQLGMAMLDAQDMVEKAVTGTLNGAQKAEYQQARDQYRNLMLLTARNTVTNPSNGDVNAQALARLLMSKDKNGFTFGGKQSDLYDAARFSQAFPPMANSGTATRSLPSLTQIPVRLGAAIGSRAYVGGANALNGARAMTPQALAQLLQNPYVESQLANSGALGAIQARSLVNPAQQ